MPILCFSNNFDNDINNFKYVCIEVLGSDNFYERKLHKHLSNEFKKAGFIILLDNGYSNLPKDAIQFPNIVLDCAATLDASKGMPFKIVIELKDYKKNTIFSYNQISPFPKKVAKNAVSELVNDGYKYNNALKKIDYIVDGIDIREVNTYNLDDFINVFLKDCNLNNINLPQQKINVIFDTEIIDPTIALAFGLGKDDEIIIKVNPNNWKKSSLQKKWYVIYHELGHDVLNLLHGQGGKMMFPFADREYNWEEFFLDKQFMFDYYKKTSKN